MSEPLSERQQKILKKYLDKKYMLPSVCNGCMGFPIYLPFMRCEWCIEKIVREYVKPIECEVRDGV